MQQRTMREAKVSTAEVQEVEDAVADPYCKPFRLSVSSLLHRLTARRLGRSVSRGDVVWLFDNTAHRASPNGPWQAEFVAAVFKKQPTCRAVDMVASIAETVGLADDAEERDTVEQRLLPFTWTVREAALVTTVCKHDGRSFKVGPTGSNGLASNVLGVSWRESSMETSAHVPRGVDGILTMRTCFAGPEGWGVISDIDDTIKITTTNDPVGILQETFANAPSPVPGMPQLYASIKALLPQDNSTWFYLSASPYNLYPFLKKFRDDYYPHGSLILRDSSWKTVSGLLSTMTVDTEEYKVDRMRKINSWLPARKMIAIGDSTQSDPEAYGEMFRSKPGWVKLILIRKVTHKDLEAKNDPMRFDRAFRGIPRDSWHVFEDPEECLDVVRDALRRFP